jgi:hypothetical protein
MKQAAGRPPGFGVDGDDLLTEMRPAVVALEIGAGPADDAVTGGVGIPVAVPALFASVVTIAALGIVIGVGVVKGAERRRGNGCRCSDGGARDRAGRSTGQKPLFCLFNSRF